MIKVAYYEFDNIGDRLSPELVRWISGDNVECDPNYTADLFAVGSILNFYSPFYRVRKGPRAWLGRHKVQLSRVFSGKLRVWGSGFLTYPVLESVIPLRTIEWHALRGKISLEILKKLSIKEIINFTKDFSLGDPGLLYEKLFPGERSIQYDLGIIPHEKDQKECSVWTKQFQKLGLQVKVLDVFSSPNVFFQELRSCDVILSSSLHGLIIADSIGIPNRHIIFSTLEHSKEDFLLKFNDYYSIYDPKDVNAPLLKNEVEDFGVTIPKILHSTYRISHQQMEECRIGIRNAFPKELIKASCFASKTMRQ